MGGRRGPPGSVYHLFYLQGRLVLDDSASGLKAWMVSPDSGDTAGMIQEGPSGAYQEAKYVWTGDTVEYFAEFRLKLISNVFDTITVCKCIVQDAHDGWVFAESTLRKYDFAADQYYTFTLSYTLRKNTLLANRPVQFRIFWYGIGDLFMDRVKVFNQNGLKLINGDYDQEIIDYINQSWSDTVIHGTGEHVVCRWYMRDEPMIDNYQPCVYVDSLLKQETPGRKGMQAFCGYAHQYVIHEYLLRVNPQELHIDPYPVARLFGDSVTGTYFQNGVSGLADWLQASRNESNYFGKDLWVTIQAWTGGLDTSDTTTCDHPLYYDDRWYCLGSREPTPYEIRLQTYLALCYGADAIMSWKYFYTNAEVYQGWLFMSGLYDQYEDSTTAKWREIRDFIGPRMKVLGPIYAPLEWKGACLDDEVGGFLLRNGQPSYLDSIRSHNPADEPHWVQVGFFEDSTADTSYFMLVNRECLENEGAVYDVFVDKAGGPYQIREMYTKSVIDTVGGVGDYFTVYLGPGEGKLFRLEQAFVSPQVIKVPDDYLTIQAAIDVATDGDTVLVAPGWYLENINFRGKGILVGSYYIFDENTATISQTLINGSNPAYPESASVVSFISGEDSSAIIKGFTICYGTGTWIPKWGHSGGGIFCYDSSPQIVYNIIANNVVHAFGGGIYCASSHSFITGNVIINNSSEVGDGGGLCCWQSSSPQIINNTFDGNSAPRGSGISCEGDTVIIMNNIISNSLDGHGIQCGSGHIVISFNDVWNNPGGNFDCSGVGDTTWGTNYNGIPCDSFYNIIWDPLFVDPGNNNFYLQDSSPCIEAGDSVSCPPYKSGCIVDMGAFEFDYGYICGNADGNKNVDVSDVMYFINYLFRSGPEPIHIEACEVNCDKEIGVSDVVYLIIYLFKNGFPPCCPY